jgi:hypothetical protein
MGKFRAGFGAFAGGAAPLHPLGFSAFRPQKLHSQNRIW